MALQLRKKGIKRVRPLAGGFYGWRDKGYPLIEFYPAEPEATPAGSSGSAASVR